MSETVVLSRRWAIAILLVIMIRPAFAEDLSWSVEGRGKFGYRSHNKDRLHYETDKNLPAEVVNPTSKERERLVVEWGRVAMGDVSQPDEEDLFGTRIWNEHVSLVASRRLGIRGKLLIESPDGKTRYPIHWVQGVRVVIARSPDEKYDWGERQEWGDATWGDFIIWNNGEFLATLCPGDLRRPVGKESRFQVALSLGEREGQKITWRNTFGVLPQSVSMLTVPGAPAISETMQIINGAPSYGQANFNPAKLVRAVNHLRTLGKEAAIAELRKFLDIALGDRQTDRVDDNIDTSENTCVFLIVRLLFGCSDANTEIPVIATMPYSPIPKLQDKRLWPLHPVHLQDDIPFLLVDSGGVEGQHDDPDRHVDWAESYGKLRDQPLRPLDNPMIAAERLIALPQAERLYAERAASEREVLFYRQAWNIVEQANPKLAKSKPFATDAQSEKPNWNERLKLVSESRFRWSEAQNKYVTD